MAKAKNIRKLNFSTLVMESCSRREFLMNSKNLEIPDGRKQIHTIQVNEDYSFVVKYIKKYRNLEFVAIIDSSLAELIAETGISNRKGKRVITTVIYYDITYKRNLKYPFSLGTLIAMCNNILTNDDEEVHHINYFRDNRFSQMQVLEHAEHGSKGGSIIRTYNEFVDYIQNDLLQVDTETFNRIKEDIITLIEAYPKRSGIFLKDINLKETALSSIIDDLDNHVDVSHR